LLTSQGTNVTNVNNIMKDYAQIAKTIRRDIIEMIYAAGSGHAGGSLSLADIFAVLYFGEMKHDPANLQWEDRDRLILSKGHAAPVLYSALARSGYFDPEYLKTLRKTDSFLEGHPAMKTPGVEVGTGSLGQGLSIGCGLAVSFIKRQTSQRVFVILGDGELQEGQNWEAFMFAGHNNLNNLTAVIDLNDLQIDGKVTEVNSIEPIADKMKSFNWDYTVIDGHDFDQIQEAFKKARLSDKPFAVIAKTVKGKGVSFMENKAEWHGKPIGKEEYDKAMKELL